MILYMEIFKRFFNLFNPLYKEGINNNVQPFHNIFIKSVKIKLCSIIDIIKKHNSKMVKKKSELC